MNEIHSLKVANKNNPVDTGRKLNVRTTFRRHPERLMYVQFTSCVNGEVSLFVPINGCSSNKNFDDLEYLLKKKLLLLELELLEISPNYVTLVSRITQLSPLQPNHRREERYFTLHITCLINLVKTQIFIRNLN